MEKFPTLAEAAAAWLNAGLRPIEKINNEHELPLRGITIKFTWNGNDYEVGVRKIEKSGVSLKR